MFEQITSVEFVAILAFGLTEIAKRAKAPAWVLNVLPTVVALGIGCLQFLDTAQVATFNEVATTGLVGVAVTMGYKGLSGLIKKTSVKEQDVYSMIVKGIKTLKQK